MENEPNKPKRQKTQKKTTKSSSDKITQEQAQALINDVLQSHLKDSQKKKRAEIDCLSATVEEFLKTFVIIGYDLNSNPVLLMNAKNQLDADALTTALTRVFLEIHNKKEL